MSYGMFPVIPSPLPGHAAAPVPAGVEATDPGFPSLSADRPPPGFMIGLPRPPSVNTFGMTVKGGMYKPLGNRSRGVQYWAVECDRLIMAMRPKPHAVKGPFTIDITWRSTDFGVFDIDNPIKPLLDYLQRIELIENDKWCRRLSVSWGPAAMGCVVRVEPAR